MALAQSLSTISEDGREGHRNAFLCFLRTLEGNSVDVVTTTGKTYHGVFHTATPFAGRDYKVAIKAAKASKGDITASDVIGSTMIFAGVDIATMSVRKSAVNFKAIGSAGDLMTDANVQSRASAKDISHLEGRKLEGVQSSWLDAGGGEELGTGKPTSWNQFEVSKDSPNKIETEPEPDHEHYPEPYPDP